MDFLYTGFVQDGDCRCYRFDGKSNDQPKKTYDISIDLSVLSKHQIAIQSGPTVCLQMLRTASASGPDNLERYENYQVTSADFVTMLAERAAAIALQKAGAPKHRKTARSPID